MSIEEKTLPVELKETSFEKYKFIRIGTIGDGSCLLHAIYFAINKSNYRSQNTDGKTDIIKNQRIRLAYEYRRLADKYVNNESLPDKFGSGTFDILLNQNHKKYKESTMNQNQIIRANEQIIADPNEYLGLEIINLVSYVEKKEIALVDVSKEYSYSNFKCYKSDKIVHSTIIFILIKKNNKHFEPLVIKESSGNLTSEFRIDSTISKELLAICDVNDEIFIKPERKNTLHGDYLKLRHNSSSYVAPYKYNVNHQKSYTPFPNNYYNYTTKYNTNSKSDKQLTIAFSTIILAILIIIVSLILYSSYY